jgi:hypothetical protein
MSDAHKAASRHGDGPQATVEALLWADPELGLVHADPHAWSLAHPCSCEALCTCEPEGG